jgi:hypothetical protein
VVVRAIIKCLQRDARTKLTYKVFKKKNRSKDTRTSPLLVARNMMHRLLACDGCNIIWERAVTCTNTRKLVHDETRTTTECDLDSIYNLRTSRSLSQEDLHTVESAMQIVACLWRPSDARDVCMLSTKSKAQNQIHAVLRLLIWASKAIMDATCI